MCLLLNLHNCFNHSFQYEHKIKKYNKENTVRYDIFLLFECNVL